MFMRRYTSDPGLATIQQIEGVVTIEGNAAPGVVGVGTGVVALVGEFADMTYGVSVDLVTTPGTVSTRPQPVQILSSDDFLTKLGGFDETIGEHKKTGGSGFVAAKNKKFAGLVAVPVNLASDKACRAWRELPTNLDATHATPLFTMVPGYVAAGREFLDVGAKAVRLMKSIAFQASAAYKSAIVGSTPACALATCVLTSIGSNFVAEGVKCGDALVLGSLAAAGGSGNLLTAGTYRIITVGTTTLTIEKQDGSNFAFAAPYTDLAYRIHAANCADTGGSGSTTLVYGFKAPGTGICNTLPVRPLFQNLVVSDVCSPTVAPPAQTASAYDPLSGLKLGGHPISVCAFTTAVQTANTTSAAGLETLYASALASLLADATPANTVNLVFCARHSAAIWTSLKNTCTQRSAKGKGLRGIMAPDLSNVTVAGVASSVAAYPAAAALRTDRASEGWPGVSVYVPEAVGFSITRADASVTTDGIFDETADGWIASAMSSVPPEVNPAIEDAPVTISPDGTPGALAFLGLQSNAPTLTIDDYITLRAAGICAPRMDDVSGPVLQSGNTTGQQLERATGTLQPIPMAQRAMADFIEDSLTGALAKFAKKPLTDDLEKDSAAVVIGFLEGLRSKLNPSKQRIYAYAVSTAANTAETRAAGVWFIDYAVTTLASANQIVQRATIGTQVVISTP